MAALHAQSPPTWDIAFIGMGAAHGILLQVLHASGQLAGKSVVIFEPSPQVHNDKTYCFWAADSDDILLSLGHLTGQSWSRVGRGDGAVEALAPLRYHRIDSARLYGASRELAEAIGAEWKACRVGPTEDPHVLVDAEGMRHRVGRVFDSRQLPAVLGRSPQVNFCVDDSRVSRSHARVDWYSGSFQLTDLSYNGTYVRFNDGEIVSLRRGSCTLHGSGTVGLGASPVDPGAACVRFEVVHLGETQPLNAIDNQTPRRAVH